MTTVGCPECKSENLYWYYTCHTYGPPWMACISCDSAVMYSCLDCAWGYTDWLNSGNPRAEENKKHRPAWLDDEVAVKSREEWGPSGITWYDNRVKDDFD